MSIVSKHYEPTERAKRIVELAQDALTSRDEVKKRVKLSIDAAKACGRLLIEERDSVTKLMGRGYWTSYYEIQFAKAIPERTGRAWMQLAAIAEIKNDAPPTTTETENEPSELLLSSNQTRLGMLALGLFPKKEAVLVADDQPTPRTDSHLTIINRFEAWHSQLKQRTSLGRMNPDERKQLLTDFRPIIEFVHQLEAI